MTAVMQNNPSLTVNDDEDDVALAAFLAPNWGRFDQDKLAFDIMSYRQTASEHHSTRHRKSSNGDIQSIQKSSSTPVLRSRDRQSMPPLYQHKQPVPRREDSPINRPSSQRRDESPKHRSPSGQSRRESPSSRSSDTSRDASPRRSSPHNQRPSHSYISYPPPSDYKVPSPQPQPIKRTPTPLPLLTQSSAQFTQERRPSVTSVASRTPSIRSEMSINTKLSLSKRLRRVFSMSSLSSKANDSTVSLQSQLSTAESDITPKPSRSSTAQSFVSSSVSQQQSVVDAAYSESSLSPISGPQPISSISSPAKPASRRRSMVSLSNIFSRNNSSSGANKQKAQHLEPTVATVVVPAQTGMNQRHSAADLRKMMNDRDQGCDKVPSQTNGTSRSPSNKPEPPKLDTSPESIHRSAKGSLKQTRRGSASNVKPPDSPSSISSASRSPVTPPPHRQLPRLQGTYAAAVSSNLSGRQRQSSLTSNSSSRADYFSAGDFEPFEDLVPPPSTGLHSLPLHGSPRMKPASQSTTSLSEPTSIREMPPTMKSRRLGFSPSITVHETFSPSEYDRRCDTNVTCCKLTPEFAMRIKQELNEYKLTGMEVHIESRQYTHFFL